MYQLVFKGQCVAGVDVETARANVAQVFKANTAQLDRMFSGERVIIRNKLDAAGAEKFQAALARQGIVVGIEPMAAGPVPAAQPREAAATAAPTKREAESETPVEPKPAETRPPAQGGGVAVEPGDRLPVAGERVDELLAGSGLSLGAPGETLGQPREHEEPVFTELQNWSVAPPGERLVEPSKQPPVAVPDLSHLQVLPPGDHG